jgi:hypothetical protein
MSPFFVPVGSSRRYVETPRVRVYLVSPVIIMYICKTNTKQNDNSILLTCYSVSSL